jgi:hypothetical protein
MFEKRLKQLIKEHQNLVERKNQPDSAWKRNIYPL